MLSNYLVRKQLNLGMGKLVTLVSGVMLSFQRLYLGHCSYLLCALAVLPVTHGEQLFPFFLFCDQVNSGVLACRN